MLNKLNYYSRYNRIKNPKDIRSLYHLMEGLNLDTVLTDDLVLRVSAMQSMHVIRKNNSSNTFSQNDEQKNKKIKNNNRFHERTQHIEFDENQANRRYASLEKPYSMKRSSHDQHNIRIKYAINNNRKLSQEQMDKQKDKQSIQNKNEMDQQKIEYSLKSGHDRSHSHHQSRNKTNNLQAMNCLQTQSIPNSISNDSGEDERASSPINAINNEDTDHRYESQKNIKKLPRVCQSQLFQTNQSNKNKIMKNQRSVNIDDQFSQGLAELDKVDEIRNSSYHNKANQEMIKDKEGVNQGYECSRSQKLFRLHGSDIEMEQRQNLEQREYRNIGHIVVQEQEVMEHIDIPAMRKYDEQLDQSNYDNQESQLKREYAPHKFNETSQSDEQQYDSETQQKRKQQLASIDNRLLAYNQHNHVQNQFRKIPSKGLSQGKWPLGGTQQSIQCGNSHDMSPFPSTFLNKSPLVNGSNIIEKQRKPFKKCILDKKLNPRLVASTIVNDGPVKKVNFKKMLKKQSLQNKKKVQLSPQNKKAKVERVVQQNKQLLKTFFEMN